jgi:hypothetical protein
LKIEDPLILSELEATAAEFERAAVRPLEEKIEQQRAKLTAAERDLPKPPLYWSMRSLKHRARRVDVTNELMHGTHQSTQEVMQDLFDQTCNPRTLGQGRDQAVQIRYSKLVVSKVYRIENPVLWQKYCMQRRVMSQQLFGQKVPQIKVGCYIAWQKPLLDPGINELYVSWNQARYRAHDPRARL